MHKYFILVMMMAQPIWAQESVIKQENYIRASGSASIALEPDQADILIGVETVSLEAKEAFEQAANRTNDMLQKLEAAGVDPVDMQTSNLSVSSSPIYDKNNQRTGTEFHVSNDLNVRVRDLEGLPDLLGELAAVGMNQVNGISFSSSERDALVDEVLQNAVKDARHRADLAAAAAGMKVVQAHDISLNFQEPQPVLRANAKFADFQAMEEPASMPISAGTIEVSARADVQFVMEPID